MTTVTDDGSTDDVVPSRRPRRVRYLVHPRDRENSTLSSMGTPTSVGLVSRLGPEDDMDRRPDIGGFDVENPLGPSPS